jgi:hypothetical protein
MRQATIILIAVFVVAGVVSAAEVKGINAEGSCAVVGMSAEQSQFIALRRARAAAIEQAAGIKVTSQTIVTNARLAVDFIRTYSRGFIIKERREWLPLGQYQRDTSTPPIPEYRVKITADVYIPEKKIRPINLAARLNSTLFRSGEKVQIKVMAAREARFAVFNIRADDMVVMLFPNQYEEDNILSGGRVILFPAWNSSIELEVQTLKGHKRDAEAFLVAAMDETSERRFRNLFRALTPMDFTTFFRKYSEVSDYCEDVILTYEVIEGNQELRIGD